MTQTTESPAPTEKDAPLPAQLAETEGIAHQNRFVLQNRKVAAYLRHDGRPWILPASFQWKGPSRVPRRPKKKPARKLYN